MHRDAFSTWFLADDFHWLNSARACLAGEEALGTYFFAPMAQGTVRPLSERAFFLGLYGIFGMQALPFRVAVFLTQFANLALLAWVARRLTGSKAAGLIAPLLWVLNFASVTVLSWASSYNQVACAFFLLCAFQFLLRYADTGKRRYWILQWAAFLLGFGALELNVVYPALAAAYTYLFERRLFRRTLWLFLPSLVFAALHRWAAGPATGVYAMHFDLAMADTLGTYWDYTLGIPWLAAFLPPFLPGYPRLVAALTAFVGVAPLLYVLSCLWRRRFMPVFMLAWFVVVIAPLLPLRHHVAEYYVFVPSLGVAWLAADALSRALRGSVALRCVAVLWLCGYVAGLLPAARQHASWLYQLSVRARWLVEGVAHARAEHPGKLVLLQGADGDVFWTTMTNRAYRLVDAEVFLTPETSAAFAAHPDWEDPALYVLPRAQTREALLLGKAIVLEIGKTGLNDVTASYAARVLRDGE